MIHGFVHPDFEGVARVLERQLRRRRPGGAAVCVYHRGEKVVDVWAGKRDLEGKPWLEDTIAMSFSTTKGVVATALHVLVDQGLANYDDAVADHWPAFGEAGKEAITIRHLLCHEAGLHGIRNAIDDARRMLDWDYMREVMEELMPAYRPGSRNGYHALTFGWLVGELIQRISGQRLDEVLAKTLIEPLELDSVYVGTPLDQRHRVAELIAPVRRPPDAPRPLAQLASTLSRVLPLPIDPEQIADALVPKGIYDILFSSDVHDAPMPALNGTFTARALARVYAALAGGGELDGTRILSPETLDRATRIQNDRVDLVIPFPMRWRLGYHLAATTRGILPRAFGHFGYGGSGGWADPERNLAVAMTTNYVSGTPVGDLRMLGIGTAAVRSAESRRVD